MRADETGETGAQIFTAKQAMNPLGFFFILDEFRLPSEGESADFKRQLWSLLQVLIPVGLPLFAGLDIEMALIVDKPNGLRMRLATFASNGGDFYC